MFRWGRGHIPLVSAVADGIKGFIGKEAVNGNQGGKVPMDI